jgi:hypothetical protein
LVATGTTAAVRDGAAALAMAATTRTETMKMLRIDRILRAPGIRSIASRSL